MAIKSQLIGAKWTHALRKREKFRGKSQEKYEYWDDRVKKLWLKYQSALEIEQNKRND